MRKIKLSLLSAAALVIFGAGSAVAAAAPEVVTLKVAHFLTSSSTFQKEILLPWCDKIGKESGGRLKCQIYPSMQLGGTPAQLFDQVRDGVADIIWALPSYQAGRFTKTEVFELPFMAKSAEKGSQALWEYIQRNSLDEFKGAKLLFTHLHDGNQFHFGSKSVKTMEDLKGLKLRAPGRLATKTLAALGAVPVQMPLPAVSEAIAKNVVDGAVTSWEVSTSIKLQEICKTHTETGPNQAKVTNNFLILAMNQARYNNLPPDLKKVIDQNSGLETSRWAGKIWEGGTAPARKIALDRHNPINVLSDVEYNRWIKATESVDDGWMKEIDAKNGSGKGKALLDDARALLKKYRD